MAVFRIFLVLGKKKNAIQLFQILVFIRNVMEAHGSGGLFSMAEVRSSAFAAGVFYSVLPNH